MVRRLQRPWRNVPDGLTVTVRLTPKGGRDALEGIERLANGATVLKARVRAVAYEDAANAALGRLLAKALDVAAGRVHLVAGTTTRIKTVKIDGDGPALSARLEALEARAAG